MASQPARCPLRITSPPLNSWQGDPSPACGSASEPQFIKLIDSGSLHAIASMFEEYLESKMDKQKGFHASLPSSELIGIWFVRYHATFCGRCGFFIDGKRINAFVYWPQYHPPPSAKIEVTSQNIRFFLERLKKKVEKEILRWLKMSFVLQNLHFDTFFLWKIGAMSRLRCSGPREAPKVPIIYQRQVIGDAVALGLKDATSFLL